jgi:hypothetical protein
LKTCPGYRLRNADVPADGVIDLMPIRDDIGMTDAFLDQVLFGAPTATTAATINNNISVSVEQYFVTDDAHELGHAVGLHDNLAGGGIVGLPGIVRADTWSPAEIKAFRLLTLTKVGTKIPDDSRGL